MPYTGPEPEVTIWRNKIPHRATLIYWGPRWIPGRNGTLLKRLLNARPRHCWTIHSPVLEPENLHIDTRGVQARWHNFRVYDEDGAQLTIGPAIDPDHA